MFNLIEITQHLTIFGWVLVTLGFIIWTGLTFIMGAFSERKWGDRESGALIGFFVPVFLFAGLLYFVQS